MKTCHANWNSLRRGSRTLRFRPSISVVWSDALRGGPAGRLIFRFLSFPIHRGFHGFANCNFQFLMAVFFNFRLLVM